MPKHDGSPTRRERKGHRRKNVFSVEVFERGHWRTLRNGTGFTSRAAALTMARRIAHDGERVSIATYTTDEGSSAIRREEI